MSLVRAAFVPSTLPFRGSLSLWTMRGSLGIVKGLAEKWKIPVNKGTHSNSKRKDRVQKNEIHDISSLCQNIKKKRYLPYRYGDRGGEMGILLRKD